jgi:hypothetical protein
LTTRPDDRRIMVSSPRAGGRHAGITSHETQQVEAANASRWHEVADVSLTFIRRFVEARPAGTRELAGAGVG